MKVGDLMTREVRVCTIHDSLNAAARIMWDHDCGCAPVVDGHGRVVGIVTDRDICMAAYTQGLPLDRIPIERVMSARVITCARGDDVETAHRLMRVHEVHRLPVVDSRGRPVGILSMSDLANHRQMDGAGVSDAAELAATLRAIRRRREPATAVSSNGDTAPARESARTPRKTSARKKKQPADLR